MNIASVADVKARLSAYLKESQEGPVIVTRNGKAVAVLLAVTDDDELERLVLAHSPKFQAILGRSRRQIEETGGISHDAFWRGVAATSSGIASEDNQDTTMHPSLKRFFNLFKESCVPPKPSRGQAGKSLAYLP